VGLPRGVATRPLPKLLGTVLLRLFLSDARLANKHGIFCGPVSVCVVVCMSITNGSFTRTSQLRIMREYLISLWDYTNNAA